MKKGVERIDYVIQRNSKSGEAEAGDGQLPSRFCNHSQENRSKNKQSHTALIDLDLLAKRPDITSDALIPGMLEIYPIP